MLEVVESEDMVRISQAGKRKWKIGDRVCLTRNTTEINCGKVIETTPSQATVILTETLPSPATAPADKRKAPVAAKKTASHGPVVKPRKGDEVWGQSEYTAYRERMGIRPANINIEVNVRGQTQAASAPGASLQRREPAAAAPSTSAKMEMRSREHGFDVSLGMNFGTSYFLPTVQAQFALGPRISAGALFQVGVQSRPAKQTTLSGFLTCSYYFVTRPFYGFFLEPRVGLYALSASDAIGSESITAPAAGLIVGWRARLTATGIGATIGAGTLYVVKMNSPRIVTFHGLYPLVSFALDYSI